MNSPSRLVAGIAAPERDPLSKLWSLDPDVRALVCVTLSFGILIFGVNGWLPCLVYVLAVAPGAVVIRSALRRYPGTVSNSALARSALAGVLGSLLILLYEELVQMAVFFVFIAHGLQSGVSVASVVFLAIGEAFLTAALCEEWVKVRLTRRALHFEGVTTPTAVMLHAAAASAAFACLENVFYLNFRAVDEMDSCKSSIKPKTTKRTVRKRRGCLHENNNRVRGMQGKAEEIAHACRMCLRCSPESAMVHRLRM